MRKKLFLFFIASITNDATFAPSGSSLPSIEPSTSPSSTTGGASPNSHDTLAPAQEIATLEPSKSYFVTVSSTNDPSYLTSSSPTESDSLISLPTNDPIPHTAPASVAPIASTQEPSDTSIPWTLPTTIPQNIPSASPSEVDSLPEGGSLEPTSFKFTWIFPTNDPIELPSDSPSNTEFPSSLSRTDAPSSATSVVNGESSSPTTTTSSKPYVILSNEPSQSPTKSPVEEPSLMPSSIPSEFPSDAPSNTAFPSSMSRTGVPSSATSVVNGESSSPTTTTSSKPYVILSNEPSQPPTKSPLEEPSLMPSSIPSEFPSDAPSNTEFPSSKSRTSVPSSASSVVSGKSSPHAPSFHPSRYPNGLASTPPSGSFNPSMTPTKLPSQIPSGSSLPSFVTLKQPSGIPSKSPLPFPSDTPTSGSSIPSHLPSSYPSSDPSNTPSLSQAPSFLFSDYTSSLPSALPSGSFLPSSVPSDEPTTVSVVDVPTTIPTMSQSSGSVDRDEWSSNPYMTPTQLPSHVPSGSSLPSFVPSKRPSGEPSYSPSGSSLPSFTPSTIPSKHPSGEPSDSPSGLSLPSFTPTTIPSKQPSGAPSDSPSGSSLPSFAPSTIPVGVSSTSPSAFSSSSVNSTLTPATATPQIPSAVVSALVTALVSVSIPCRSQMDVPTTQVFETTTLNFLTEFLPSDSGITVTEVNVTKQTLITASKRSLRARELKESSELEIEMLVEGKQHQGTERSDSFTDEIELAFKNNPDAFKEKLSEASSFFLGEFAFANSDDRDISISVSQEGGGAEDEGSKIAIIIGAVVGSLAVIFAATMLFLKHRRCKEESVRPLDLMSWSTSNEVDHGERRVDLGSWSAKTPSAASGNGNTSYGFLDKEEAFSPTDSEVYGDDDRYTAGASPGQLSPIAESNDTRSEDWQLAQPKRDVMLSQVTARGSRLLRDSRTSPRAKTDSILGDLVSMEGEWEGQLESKVDAVSETPKQNNLEKFKVGNGLK